MSKDESKKSLEPTVPEQPNPDDSATSDANIVHAPADEELSEGDHISTTLPTEMGGEMPSVSIQRTEHRFSGPIPPPEVMKVYGEVNTSIPGQIMAMAEKQGNHRRDLECALSTAKIRDMHEDRVERRNGQFLAGFVALAILGAVVWVTLAGQPAVGGGLVAVLVGVIALFVTGKYSRGHNTTDNDENA